jgi:hypothetical protein
MADESLRDTLEAAVAASEAPATPSAPAPTPAPADAAPPGEAKPDASERERDASGRFVARRDLITGEIPDALKPAKPTDAHPKPGTTPVVEPKPDAPPRFKAPSSWKPEVREEFAKLPPGVQAEIARRETEITRGMQSAAQYRAAVEQLQSVVQPYLGNIQAANGGDVVGAIKLYLQTDHTLRHGTTAERAALMADIIKNYGVNIEALDAALAGQPRADGPEELIARKLRAEMQRELQPVMGFFNQLQESRARREGALRGEVQEEVEQFAQDPAAPHFEELREEMADLMEVAARRGLTMTLKQAYDRAIALHPKLAEEAGKRAEQERANAAAEAAAKAKRAAVSLPSGGAPQGSPPGESAANTLRADLEAAIAANAGR